MSSTSPLSPSLAQAFDAATAAARHYRGATAPNPPVGCALLDGEGRMLAVEAHARAGEPHAEAAALAACREKGLIEALHTVVVTLEPCNHWGRTPPCAEAILDTPARAVWIGVPDPDHSVTGGGEARLRAAGLDVRRLDTVASGPLPQLAACRDLIAPFAKQRRTGRPWVTVKQALDRAGSMIPPPGRTTFTSAPALLLAHRLRRRADAILTGSGTVLADEPVFTVRRVEDHPGKRRMLGILDRRRRVPRSYFAAATARGFEVFVADDAEEALDRIGRAGSLEVLVEAGPAVTAAMIERSLWDQHIVIRQTDGAETVEIRREDGTGERAFRTVEDALDA